MTIQPKIVTSPVRKLVGMSQVMHFGDYQVGALWSRFFPRRSEVMHRTGEDMISMAIYGERFFERLDLDRPFDKWATCEVSSLADIPEGMEIYTLPGGLYAVFDYVGLNTDNTIYQYIHRTWLPASDYELDLRPHFEVLGPKYKNNDPQSQEEIWIPIKPRS